jgi:DNA polymerase III epsilon subunit-like protein
MKLFIDTETSGLPSVFTHYTDLTAYASARVLSIGLLHGKETYYTTISDNILYLHTDAKAIHKLTIKEMVNGTKFKDFMVTWRKFKPTAIVGYNVAFDVNVLCSEMHRNGFQEDVKDSTCVCYEIVQRCC